MSTQPAVEAEMEAELTTFQKFVRTLYFVAILVAFSALGPRMPEFAGKIALAFIGTTCTIQLGREFLRGSRSSKVSRARSSSQAPIAS